MKTNELRVLNYVLDIGDKICQVMRVHANGVVGLSAVDGSYQWESFNLENDVKPTLLTEEWLLKFGFRKGLLDDITIYTKGKIQVTPTTTTTTYCGNFVKFCFHVHTLQNLYFALTGEELEMK